MTRRVGLPSLPAREMLQRDVDVATGVHYDVTGKQPLPTPTTDAPYRAKAGDLGIKDSKSLRFFVIGDHGGVKDPAPQAAVSNAMQALERPAFVYSVGDVVYFNGDASEYAVQFLEPYAHLDVPILAIPGNHDGDVTDVPGREPLDTFMANFCSASPGRPPADAAGEYGRDTQTQPYCHWTLESEAVTIVGCYSNVNSGGTIEPEQADWLEGELAAAPTDRPLILALHHPPYSADGFHGGSKRMGDVIDKAAEAAGRWPDLVLAGHVHNFQRFTRTLPSGKAVTYAVVGASGYHNRHRLAADVHPGSEVVPGIVFEAGDDQQWGFLTLEVADGKISGEYTGVTRDGVVTPNVDAFII